jgi:hypothetical protein
MAGPGSPLDTTSLTRYFKNTGEKYYSYRADERFVEAGLGDIIVYDVPLVDVLEKDADGNLPRRYMQDNSSGADGRYVMEELPLPPAEFRFGPQEPYPYIPSTQLSVYAFAYIDRSSLNDGEEREVRLNEHSGLSTGMGYMNPYTFMGLFYRYEKSQTPLTQDYKYSEGRVVWSPVDAPDASVLAGSPGDRGNYNSFSTLDAPDQSKYHDMRGVSARGMGRFNLRLHDRFLTSLSTTSAGRGYANSIKDKNYFSPLWVSKDLNDNGRYCFSFDMRSYFIQKSAFPVLYMLPGTFKELTQGGNFISRNNEDGVDERSHILDFMVKKKIATFHQYASNNDLPTVLRSKEEAPSYYYPQTILPQPEVITNIYLPENEGSDEEILFYEGLDLCKDDFKVENMSRFSYSAHFYLKDSAPLLLQNCARLMREVQNNIRRIYDMIVNSVPLNTAKVIEYHPHGFGADFVESPILDRRVFNGGLIVDGRGLFDYKTRRRAIPLSLIGVGGQLDAYGYISKNLKMYTDTLSLLGITTEAESRGLQLILLAVANLPHIEAMEEIIRVVDMFAKMLEDTSSSVSLGDRYKDGQIQKSKLERRGFCQRKLIILEEHHTFDNLFEFGRQFGTGYEYLSWDKGRGYPVNGILRISKAEHRERASEEFYKYFDFSKNPGDDLRESAPFSDFYSTPSYNFFSPRLVHVYGRTAVNQPRFKSSDAPTIKYDLNRYGELFSDIIRLQHKTKYLNRVFYESVGDTAFDSSNEQLFNTLKESLGEKQCVIETDTDHQFSVPTPKEFPSQGLPTTGESAGFPSPYDFIFRSENLRLLPHIMGGTNSRIATTLTYFSNTEAEVKSKGAETKAKGQDKRIKQPIKKTGLPIKLTFGILGELVLDPTGINDENYESQVFNSLVNQANTLGFSPDTAKELLEGNFAHLPNQMKSMFVLATCREYLAPPLGTGFDAVRDIMHDKDPGLPAQLLSAIIAPLSTTELDSTKDPMKTYAKFLAFWLNYKQLVTLEYLAGFDGLDLEFQRTHTSGGFTRILDESPSGHHSAKRRLPMWRKFTANFYQQNLEKSFFCRLRTIVDADINTPSPSVSTQFKDSGTAYGVTSSRAFTASEVSTPLHNLMGYETSNPPPPSGIDVPHNSQFNLPIYDQYFILEGSGVAVKPKEQPPSDKTANPPKTADLTEPPGQTQIWGVVPQGYGSYGDK